MPSRQSLRHCEGLSELVTKRKRLPKHEGASLKQKIVVDVVFGPVATLIVFGLLGVQVVGPMELGYFALLFPGILLGAPLLPFVIPLLGIVLLLLHLM